MNIYLDWNATTPPLPEVVKRMVEAAETAWGNPSSIHSDGRRARRLVEEARIAVGELTGADPKDIVLTGGGTEANNLALRSALKDATYTLLTSRMEHPSVTKVAEWHAARGGAVHWLRVKADGCVDLDDIARALTKEKCVLALQAVNHETGVIQPVEEALLLAKKVNAHTHVDAVQAYGKIAVNYAADTQTIGAHKIRGPKGIGALIHLPHVRIEPVLVGGAQEKGLRPGTSDPVAAAGFAVAVRHAASGPARYKKVAALRDRFEAAVLPLQAEARRVGSAGRVPHVSNIVWPGWGGAEMIAALDLEGVSVSSGSACSAGTIEASPVLRELVGEELARSGVRVSMGDETSEEDIGRAIEAFRTVVSRV